jgi:hypothetical protein
LEIEIDFIDHQQSDMVSQVDVIKHLVAPKGSAGILTGEYYFL